MNFIETQIKKMEKFGFWAEEGRNTIIRMIESQYKTEIIREWAIVDLIFSHKKVLVKWEKRFRPLTDEELKKSYKR